MAALRRELGERAPYSIFRPSMGTPECRCECREALVQEEGTVRRGHLGQGKTYVMAGKAPESHSAIAERPSYSAPGTRHAFSVLLAPDQLLTTTILAVRYLPTPTQVKPESYLCRNALELATRGSAARSTMVIVGGTRYQVEWNLYRCLLSPSLCYRTP
jgi:hypothetical protein